MGRNYYKTFKPLSLRMMSRADLSSAPSDCAVVVVVSDSCNIEHF